MNIKKNSIIGIIAVFALALFASTAMAWGPGSGRGMGYGLCYGNPPVSNLTPEQSSKIQAIQQANLKDIVPLQQQLFAKKTELRSLWLSQNPDQAQINALQKDMLNISAKLQEKATNARFEMRKVLIPEQLAQLTTPGSDVGYGMGKMGGRMGRW
jgi:Spy/CpxP family protein refolding chaperone